MTASDKSFVGLAKQTAKGTPNTTDSAFVYLLFNQGMAAPQNVVVPLDDEVGGGAMARGVTKMGVTSGGQLAFVPRPKSIGHFLMGALGASAAPVAHGASLTAKDHVFTLGADQFAAPYYTLRSAPGSLLGEQLQDVRVANLALTWKALDYARATVGLVGGLPATAATASWDALAKVDGGPQFIAPVMSISSPVGGRFDGLKVLSGAVMMGMNIPLDEQWITGSYTPDDFDITQRSFAATMTIKVDPTQAALYKELMYDAAGGATWQPNILRDGDIALEFRSDQLADTGIPYALKIEANGASGAGGNVAWSVTPISMRAGRPLVAVLTGVFLASPDGSEPITVTLTNTETTQY